MDREGSDAERPPSRIVVADDHPLFRSALIQILNARADLEVVGEAADGQEAIELCRRLRPQLVLMDVRMPQVDGLEATRTIKREFPRTIVLMLTAFEDPNYLSEALKAGAGGYVLKHEPAPQIIDAVRKVLTGESPLNQEVAMRLLTRLIEEEVPKEVTLEETPRRGSLSPREVDVLRLIAQGQTNQQIAQRLFISVSTVKKHVRSIVSKLGVSDRVQAAIRAIELGVLPEQEE